MSVSKSTQSNVSFVVASITAASVFCAPGVAHAGAGADARSAIQRTLAAQNGGILSDASIGTITTSAGSQAGLLAAQAGLQLTKNQQQRQALQSLQDAARAAAKASISTVPNGLAPGGLAVAPGADADASLWSGAALPAAQMVNGRFLVTISQTDPQALLTWTTFNIGRDTTLKFDQAKSDWIAFNKIVDPSGNPSRILGSIDAPGQVYVINPNGIIFGGGAQVNTRTLVASSLPINDALVARGLLNNPDTQFLFSGLAQPAGSQTNAFTPPAPATADGRYGDVLVEAGAILSSPTNADKSGGRIALIGANVTNSGTISTPDGQTILAAGLQVGLEASTDTSLRGLLPSVGQVGDYAGAATNAGLIDAARGAITITGKSVAQNGLAGSTTSVSRNGRVDLLAQYDAIGVGDYSNLPDFFPTSTGLVTFGQNSVTEILPELSSGEKVVGTRLALTSQLNARGLAVHMAQDSSVLAPSGSVGFDAGRWQVYQLGTNQANEQFLYTGGQVFLDEGSTVNVAGSAGVTVSVADNIIEASLRGDELANSPLQRDGALRGQTIKVDILQSGTYDGRSWVGTPLADVSGYVNLVQRDIGQLTTKGGSVKLNAGDSVVIDVGASIDVSGGYVNYESAVVETSKVVYQGNLLDISKATPDLVYSELYSGVFTPLTNVAKWGAAAAASRQSENRLFVRQVQPGYLYGGDAGSVSISAPSLAVDGNLQGHSVSGPRQTGAPARSGALSLGLQGQYYDASSPTGYFNDSRTAPVVRFDSAPALPRATAFALDAAGLPLPLRTERVSSLVLDPAALTGAGFGRITVDNREGDVVVAAGSEVALPASGEFSLAGKNVRVDANLSAPGGKITLTATAVSQGAINRASIAGSAPSAGPDRGLVAVAGGVKVSAAGVVENYAVGTAEDPAVIGGGTVAITGYDVTLGAGSVIDVSGGLYAAPGARYSYGVGGTVSILAGQDANIKSAVGGTLSLGSDLLGYSGTKGGTLVLQAPAIQVGTGPAAANATVLDADFFREGGFTSYDIRGLGGILDADKDAFSPGVLITSGTVIAPVAESYVAQPDLAATEKLSLTPRLLDQSLRGAAGVAFSAPGVRDAFNAAFPLVVRGDLVVESGARIETDPGAKITLSGDTVNVQGALVAHGGAIGLKGAADSNIVFPRSANGSPVATLTVGSTALLDASGVAVLQPDVSGRDLRIGRVLGGGAISLAGNIRAAAGSVMDVSGATAMLDLDPVYGGRTGGVAGLNQLATRVDSSGGTLALAGSQQLITAATLLGGAGGPSAEGGKLSVSSGIYVPVGGAVTTQRDANLIVTQSVSNAPDSIRGNFAADSFNTSGFDSLTLGGTISFSGPVSIEARRDLRVASTGVLYGTDSVSLAAARVGIGSALQNPLLADKDDSRVFYDANNTPFSIAPVHGDARLNIVAGQLIDVGNLTLQGFGAAALQTAAGDIRGSGTFDIAGDLTLTAAQVYPPTATVFSLNAYDYTVGGSARSGSITVRSGAARPGLPLSGGGTLNLHASTIVQDGTLRAPLGVINLGWNGVGVAPVDRITGLAAPKTQTITLGSHGVTSVSAVDPVSGKALTIPYGAYVNGSTWVDPQGRDITDQGPVAKAVTLSAGSVTTEAGSIIDLDGGGDLLASRFKTGTGGKIDLLAATSRFAIVPGYSAEYAPFGAFNDTVNGQDLLGGDRGYVNASLNAGDRIYLEASPGLAAGFYTLLPARYAVLPGAFLVTPSANAPLGSTAVQPDQSAFVTGYRFNSTGGAPAATPLRALFEVASSEVVQKRATYETPLATPFFRENAADRDVLAPRLAVDAGQLVFDATTAMNLAGSLKARAASGGLGGQVDISSPGDIRIVAPGATAQPGALTLDAASLSSFNGASLLVGGSRVSGDNGAAVNVRADSITLDNAGSALSGAEIILAARKTIDIAASAELTQTGTLGGAADTLFFGDASVAGSGDGALLRVSSDASGSLSRAGVTSGSTARISLGAGSRIDGGASFVLDSTGTTHIDALADFGGRSLTLNSGRISLQLDAPGVLQPDAGLVLNSIALDALQASSKRLSLLSYSSVDIYGSGTVGTSAFEQLTIGAPLLRGYNTGGGEAAFLARSIALNGGVGGSAPAASSASLGTLSFTADTLEIGAGSLSVRQYSGLELRASNHLLLSGKGGLDTSADLAIETPLVTAATAARQSVVAAGSLAISAPSIVASATARPTTGIGAQVSFTGGRGLSIESDLAFASGRLALHAGSGDLSIGESAATRVDVGGVSRAIQSSTVYTDGGALSLLADTGDIRLGVSSTLSVAALSAGGDAGELSVTAPTGRLLANGALLGSSGSSASGGEFTSDVKTLADGTLSSLDALLNSGGFDLGRSHRIRSGDVQISGVINSAAYLVSADLGSLTVTGTIDASGRTGGTIDLSAHGDLTVVAGALLDASATDFNNAGKGGSVRLAAGSSLNGVANSAAYLTLADGATIDLSVASSDPAKDASLGHATGTLHLRAPRSNSGADLAVRAIAADIVGASSVVLEGFKVADLTPVSGTSATINASVRNAVLGDAATFGNASASILARVGGAAQAGLLHVQPGIELVNRTGDLVLDGIWDLSTARYGAGSIAAREPGVLTLRAAGNISLPYSASGSASLSDGFGTGASALSSSTSLWEATLLPEGSRSWSYHLAAGADLTSARTLAVLAADAAAPAKGSVLIGSGAPAFSAALDTRQAANGVPAYYQVIRTGTGDISLAARGDIELRNNLATIYTAGTQAAAIADFDVPDTGYNRAATDLGTRQYTTNAYAAQYALGGGDVSLFARNNIFRTFAGATDSSQQMPANWLYRRGNIDASTGEFSAYSNATANGPRTQRNSTSWWIDYNNFFEGVGALGGGNVSVSAGADVANIDAVAPTNARLPHGRPDASRLVELGGGDVTIRAGGDIDGGVYYVERGAGTLSAGGDITTNSTRTTLRASEYFSGAQTAASTWLPTTLFLGKGSFDLSAGGDLLLGAVANPFLLPGGINNSYFLKSYFSTYGDESAVGAFSLTGDVDLRSRNSNLSTGSLYDWFNNVLRRDTVTPTGTLAGKNQPWLRLYERDVTNFAVASTLMPGSLTAVAVSGDLNLIGEINLLPSSAGRLELLAADSINGLRPVGLATGSTAQQWASASLNFSDADPARLPDVTSPLSVSIQGLNNNSVVNVVTRTAPDFTGLDALFAESGSYTGDIYGRLQTKQTLHAATSVHAGATEPVRLAAGAGDISGLTLYSARVTELLAGRDISDVGLYIQNLRATDLSIVSAGRDILLYNPTSALRSAAQAAGSALLATGARAPGPATGNPNTGDLQIGGSGALLVKAGRNVDLGATLPPDDGISGGLKAPIDGTAVGLTSIGNARNLNLPDEGARVIVGVGLGDGTKIDRSAFERAFLDPSTSDGNAARYLAVLATQLGLAADAEAPAIWSAYSALSARDREPLMLAAFNRVLRDAGRDHNDPEAPGFGTYQGGFDAIAALFADDDWQGDFRLSSRELRTAAGGDIIVYAPGGGVNLGSDISTSQTPPGIITERGGGISIFTRDDVDIGTQRIFTLRGGDILIWSSTGDIAAGSSSTTLQSASPTRVLVDPQTADVKTDLAGLATGGGIGVLAATEGVQAGDVDLIAPVGTIDAGDAGIRSAGNLNIAALTVLNSANISAGGATSGAPAVAAPNIGGLSAASSASAAANTASTAAAPAAASPTKSIALPSIIAVEVLGYGGDTDPEDDKKDDAT